VQYNAKTKNFNEDEIFQVKEYGRFFHVYADKTTSLTY